MPEPRTQRDTTRIRWDGERRDYESYSRAHRIAVPGEPPLPASANPSFRKSGHPPIPLSVAIRVAAIAI